MFRRNVSRLSQAKATSAALGQYLKGAAKWTVGGVLAGGVTAYSYDRYVKKVSCTEESEALLCHAGWFGTGSSAPAPAPAAPVQAALKPVDVHKNLPVELAQLTYAPEVPPPIKRRYPVLLRVDITYDSWVAPLTRKWKYEFWGFNGHCPGPFIRARVGDVMEVNVKNNDKSGMPHNIDFHSCDGPGGGAPLLLADEGRTKSCQLKLLNPGLYVYHCAAAPIPLHIANGMYGLILVEPAGGMTAVDKEYYIMQSEFYIEPPEKGESVAAPAYDLGLKELADVCVFNGREGSLTDKDVLKCQVGERVRLFVGNGGPNLSSGFHVIGTVFDYLYREGDIISPPARMVQTTTIPPGGSAIVEMDIKVPGNYTLVDHALFRLDKGCVGFLQARGDPAPDIYHSSEYPTPCPGCKVHP